MEPLEELAEKLTGEACLMVGTGRFELPNGSALPRTPRRPGLAASTKGGCRIGALAVGSDG